MPPDIDKVKSLISAGSEIAGPTAGAAIGFLAGGPGGAALGGFLGVVIPKGLSDMTDRFLSSREKTRVGATASFAIARIKARLDSGDELRNDGFFQDKGEGRTDAEEIFEGVLLKAKNEHEEKKTIILGNIFANTAFYSTISVGQANHVLRIAENLTYRQMCILSLIKRKHEIQGIKLGEDSCAERQERAASYETISLLQEACDLDRLGLIGCMDKSRKDYELMMDWGSVAPNRLELTLIGGRYYQVMGLEDIPEEDIRGVAKLFS